MRISRPPINNEFRTLRRPPSVFGRCFIALRVRLNPVTELAERIGATVYTVRLPEVKWGRKRVTKGWVAVVASTEAEELLFQFCGCGGVLHGFVHVVDGRLDILRAISPTIRIHSPPDRLKVEAHIHRSLDWGTGSVRGINGVGVPVAHESSTHGRIRASDENPGRLVGGESVFDSWA